MDAHPLREQLGIEEPPREREALIAEIYDRLAIVREDGRHAVLIIDDAQALASPETLSEICGLLKLEYEDRRLLSLVLAGTPNLAEAIGSDDIISHRVDVKVGLEAFDVQTASDYLLHRVRQAGGDGAMLDATCVAALHRFGRGIPGLMNTPGRQRDVRGLSVWPQVRQRDGRRTQRIATSDGNSIPRLRGRGSGCDRSAGPRPRHPWRSSNQSQPPQRSTSPSPPVDVSMPPNQPVFAPLRGGSLEDLDSELEAVFEASSDDAAQRVVDRSDEASEAMGSFVHRPKVRRRTRKRRRKTCSSS